MTAKVLVLHTGARDGYQVALALHEADLLNVLVTNGYSGAVLTGLDRLIGKYAGISDGLNGRFCAGLPLSRVVSVLGPDVASIGARKLGTFAHSKVFQWQERVLAKRAAELARRNNCVAVLSYNYCAYPLFKELENTSIKRILFQCHPHPLAAKQILEEEQKRSPSAAALMEEKELAWGEGYLNQLIAEPEMADLVIAASSFTRDTLQNHGIDPKKISIVPYGSDSPRFGQSVDRSDKDGSRPFSILFVGQMGHRKGLRYLLDACQRIGMKNSRLDICGRGFELGLDRPIPPWAHVHRNLSEDDLAERYRRADVFVLPSILEGFGLVILEAMRFGVPVVATTASGGPDVIQDGQSGFLVPPRDVEALATTLDRLRCRPVLLASLGASARASADSFTWKRFRSSIAETVRTGL